MAFLDKLNRCDQIFPSRTADRRTDNHFRHTGNRGNNKTGQNFSIREKVGNKVRTFGRKIRSCRENSGRRTKHGHGFLYTDRDRPGPPRETFWRTLPGSMDAAPSIREGRKTSGTFLLVLFRPTLQAFSAEPQASPRERSAWREERQNVRGQKTKRSGKRRRTPSG